MMSIETWSPITQLDGTVEETLRGDLAPVDILHRSWRRFTASLDEADRHTLRRRTLRKHAIETGIIERLYDIDWGVTEQLVAEGLTREAVARAGGELSEGVLAMLQAQFEGLQLAAEYVREDWPLTTSFIRQLHALITRSQMYYEATDALGRRTRAKLNHGSFKTLPNNVRRDDGSLLEFAPPEQIDGEIERLVKWHNRMEDVHPVVSAAWLHHRFVQIHPFQDGNGRVARALTLVALGRAQYPPLVVEDRHRPDYLRSLDLANDGDLTKLGRLFAKLAVRSIRSELEVPLPDPLSDPGPTPRTAKEIARFHAQRLRRQEQEDAAQVELAVHFRAQQLHAQIHDWLKTAGSDLEQVYAEEDRNVRPTTKAAEEHPYDEKWWRWQIIQSAKRADHFAYLFPNTRSWWASLQVVVNGLRMRFVTSIHHVGSLRTGVMAVTSFADIRELQGESSHEEAFVETSWEAFTFSHDEEVENRATELYEWLDESLAVALQEFIRRTLRG